MIIEKDRINILGICTLYTIIFNFTYVFIISPYYKEYGYTFHEPTFSSLLLTFIVALIPSSWLNININKQKPSQIVYLFLYYLVYIPTCFIPLYTIKIDTEFIIFYNLVLLISLLLLHIILNLNMINIPRIKISTNFFWGLIIICSLLVYSFIGFTVNFSFNLKLSDAYFIRTDYSQIALEQGKYFAYAVEWQANAINNFLLAYGITYRKVFIFIAGIFGQAFIYSITGFKSVLLVPLLIIAIVIICIAFKKKLAINMGLGLITMIMAGIILFALYEEIIILNLFVRRMIVVPGLLSGFYLDYFSHNPLVFMSDSILNYLSDFPYKLPVPNIIGLNYLGDLGTHANANFWANAFSNFGHIGIIVFSIILGFILLIYDSISKRIDYRIACCVIAIHAFTLTNTALQTTLLSHGMALSFLIIYFVPQIPKKKHKRLIPQ